MNIRLATENDIPAILSIFNDALLTTTAVYSYQPASLLEQLEWFRHKTEAGIPVLVSEDDHGLTGYVTYGPFRIRPAYKYTMELSIYVDKRAQNQGIGWIWSSIPWSSKGLPIPSKPKKKVIRLNDFLYDFEIHPLASSIAKHIRSRTEDPIGHHGDVDPDDPQFEVDSQDIRHQDPDHKHGPNRVHHREFGVPGCP